MLYSEFYDRTKTVVDGAEYDVIEQAYYDFDGDKDEFCRWWLKAVKNGYWDREKKLRMNLNSTHERMNLKIKDLFDQLEVENDRFVNEYRKNMEKEEVIKSQEAEIRELRIKVAEFNKLMDALSVLKNCL